MARTLSREARARRYLQASMEAGYTNQAPEVREAKHSLMRAHERAYSGVRRHALAGARRHFDEPLTAGEREHQTHLRREEGMRNADVERIQKELDTPPAERRRQRDTLAGRARAGAQPAIDTARATASGAGELLPTGGGGWMYAVGLGLSLILIYLLIAGKGAKAITGLVGIFTGGVRAFVAPVDPLAAAERALGAAPIATAGAASAATGSPTGSGGGPVPKANAAGYVAPFTGATAERVDQGQDFALKPGAAIRAIGPAKVTEIVPNWSQGQPLVAYTLTGGPQKGHSVYVAEQITPTVKVGQQLKAGDVIGHYANTGTGIETGWADSIGAGGQLAQSREFTGANATRAGKSFSSFLAALGVPV
jgi:murein DD-endopeptidase MepM/ murein hydrolase activator NlpD